MNDCPIIQIQKVANGYVVTLPYAVNPYEGMAAPMQKVMGNMDLLQQIEEAEKVKQKDSFPITVHVYIFGTFEKVLAFLADRYV